MKRNRILTIFLTLTLISLFLCGNAMAAEYNIASGDITIKNINSTHLNITGESDDVPRTDPIIITGGTGSGTDNTVIIDGKQSVLKRNWLKPQIKIMI